MEVIVVAEEEAEEAVTAEDVGDVERRGEGHVQVVPLHLKARR